MAIEFKSLIFTLSTIDEANQKGIADDMLLLSKITSENWPNILQSIKKIILAKTDRERVQLLNKFVDTKLLANHQTAVACHRFISFFFSNLAKEETKSDTPEIIFSDLEKMGGFDTEEAKNSILTLLNLIKKESGWYQNEKRQVSYQSGLFPFLKGVGTTVELRGIFERMFHIGEKADEIIKEISEKNIKTTPVISVSISLDSGDPDRFCFQASPESVEWLIEELKFALHQCKLLKQQHGGDN